VIDYLILVKILNNSFSVIISIVLNYVNKISNLNHFKKSCFENNYKKKISNDFDKTITIFNI